MNEIEIEIIFDDKYYFVIGTLLLVYENIKALKDFYFFLIFQNLYQHKKLKIIKLCNFLI